MQSKEGAAKESFQFSDVQGPIPDQWQIQWGEGGGGGEGCQPDPELSPKTIFSALQASVWSKNKGGLPLDPPVITV